MVPEYSNDEGRVLSVGVVGASGWANASHLPALAGMPGLRPAAVATTRDDSARAAAERWGADRWFTSPAELAADPDVELVTVSVKAPLHREVIAQVLPAGKPILCEWPMGVSTREALEIAEAASRAGVRLFVGLQAAANPVLREVGGLVAGGVVGTVLGVTVRVSRGSARPVPASSSYTLDAANGAGMVEILGGHALSAVLTALGQGTTGVASRTKGRTSLVDTARVSSDGAPIRVTSPDVAVGWIDLAPGLASLSFAESDLDPGAEITVVGVEGRVVISTVGTGDLRLQQPQMADWAAEITTADGARRIAPPELDLPIAARNPARLYQLVRRDLRDGTALSPDARYAIDVHAVLDQFERLPSADL